MVPRDNQELAVNCLAQNLRSLGLGQAAFFIQPKTAGSHDSRRLGRNHESRLVSGSVSGPKYDHEVGWFGIVSCQTVGVAPVGKIYYLPRLASCLSRFGRFHNVESVVVEEKSVISEYFIELRNHWMIVGNGLGLELAQGSLDF